MDPAAILRRSASDRADDRIGPAPPMASEAKDFAFTKLERNRCRQSGRQEILNLEHNFAWRSATRREHLLEATAQQALDENIDVQVLNIDWLETLSVAEDSHAIRDVEDFGQPVRNIDD